MSIALTIYSRPGCHLCDEMKHLVQRVTARMSVPIAIEEIDISGDPELEARYGEEIPVLLVDGRKVAKYRISEIDLTRALDARQSSPL
jgi:glutaredoxin